MTEFCTVCKRDVIAGHTCGPDPSRITFGPQVTQGEPPKKFCCGKAVTFKSACPCTSVECSLAHEPYWHCYVCGKNKITPRRIGASYEDTGTTPPFAARPHWMCLFGTLNTMCQHPECKPEKFPLKPAARPSSEPSAPLCLKCGAVMVKQAWGMSENIVVLPQWLCPDCGARTECSEPNAPASSGQESPRKCGKFAASFIPRRGEYFSCVLEPEHGGECRPGGNCFKHGPYASEPHKHPHCPSCVKEESARQGAAQSGPWSVDDISPLVNQDSPEPVAQSAKEEPCQNENPSLANVHSVVIPSNREESACVKSVSPIGHKTATQSGAGGDCQYGRFCKTHGVIHDETGDANNNIKAATPAVEAQGTGDAPLLAKLREKVDEGGHDGWHEDGLHIAAANRIQELLNWLGTEQAMHRAWRKRAEECEAPQPLARVEPDPLNPLLDMQVVENLSAALEKAMAATTQLVEGESAEQLKHGRSCVALTPGHDDECTCGLRYRIYLQTEQTMSAAWRKRAEQSEREAAHLQTKLTQALADNRLLIKAETEARRELDAMLIIAGKTIVEQVRAAKAERKLEAAEAQLKEIGGVVGIPPLKDGEEVPSVLNRVRRVMNIFQERAGNHVQEKISLEAQLKKVEGERDAAQAWSNKWEGLSSAQDKTIASLEQETGRLRSALEVISHLGAFQGTTAANLAVAALTPKPPQEGK